MVQKSCIAFSSRVGEGAGHAGPNFAKINQMNLEVIHVKHIYLSIILLLAGCPDSARVLEQMKADPSWLERQSTAYLSTECENGNKKACEIWLNQ